MNAERLLNVAKALRESPNPENFDMVVVVEESCGTPGCAFGHYAARADLQDAFRVEQRRELGGFAVIKAVDGMYCPYDHPVVAEHFGLSKMDLEELFCGAGCGDAQTPIEAAEYIEKFVRERQGGGS